MSHLRFHMDFPLQSLGTHGQRPHVPPFGTLTPSISEPMWNVPPMSEARSPALWHHRRPEQNLFHTSKVTSPSHGHPNAIVSESKGSLLPKSEVIPTLYSDVLTFTVSETKGSICPNTALHLNLSFSGPAWGASYSSGQRTDPCQPWKSTLSLLTHTDHPCRDHTFS